jgi:hypothetical protein
MRKVFSCQVGALLGAFMLTACGGGSDVQADAESNVITAGSSRLGVVDLTEVESSGLGGSTSFDVDLEASFFATSSAFVDAYVAQEPEIPLGTCKIGSKLEDLDSENDGFALPVIPGVVRATLTSLDAGTTVNVKTGDTDYKIATRKTIEFGGQVNFAYSGASDGVGDAETSDAPIPDEKLTLRIPGSSGGFPGLTVDFPSVPPVKISSPALVKEVDLVEDGTDLSLFIRPVTVGTIFRWEPRKESDPSSYIRIFATRLFIDKYIECNVPDSGSFFLPDTIDFSGTLALWDFSRIARYVYVDPTTGATVVINTERGVSTSL